MMAISYMTPKSTKHLQIYQLPGLTANHPLVRPIVPSMVAEESLFTQSPSCGVQLTHMHTKLSTIQVVLSASRVMFLRTRLNEDPLTHCLKLTR